MKKTYTKSLLLIVAMTMGINAWAENSVNVIFNGTDHVNGKNSLRITNGKNNNDNVVSNSINKNGIGIQDGKLVVSMPLQNGQTAKWRGDLQFGETWNGNKGVFANFNKEDKFIAVKFLGPMPVSSIGFEFSVRTGEEGSYTYTTYSASNQKTAVKTTAGNTIVYISLAGCSHKDAGNYVIPTDETTKTITYLCFKIADATFQTTYKIDWIKTFSAEPTAEECAVADDGKSPDAEGTQANDYDELPIYDETNGKYFANFETALVGTVSSSKITYTNINVGDVLVLNSDVNVSTSNIPNLNGLTVKGADNKNIIVRSQLIGKGAAFYSSNDNNVKTTISAGENGTLTIDGHNIEHTYCYFEMRHGHVFNNVIFKNLKVKENGTSSVLDLKDDWRNITLNGCSFYNCYGKSTNYNAEAIINCRNEKHTITLMGDNNFNGVNALFLNSGSTVDAKDATQTTVVYLSSSANVTNKTIVKNSTDLSIFQLRGALSTTQPTYMLKVSGANLVTATDYDLVVSAAGAATLCLPYNATIPANVKCYTLNYTSGETVTATPVETTLSANTPVYVKAAEGTYNFAMAEDDSIHYAEAKFGALTGVYAITNVPADSYILYNGTSGVGFYKSNSSTVAPYHAYLTAEASSAKSITIVFDDEPTGINDVTENNSKTSSAIKFVKNGQLLIKTANGTFNAAGQLIK